VATKINQLLKQWPRSTVALQSWLETEGISRKLSHRYVEAGWLERLGHGAYIRSDDTVNWRGAIYALQKHANLAIWPGGATALQLQGLSQYIPMQREKIWLWGAAGSRLPAWFKNHDWRVSVKFNGARLFARSVPDQFHYKKDGYVIEASSMERASFELAYEIRDGESFNWAAEQFQGLVNLRPQLMQQYLEACTSIRVKRLVLLLGTYYGQVWAQRLDRSRINLGSGKRQVVKNGWLHPELQITVPREFASG
jgi:hypothetical protein